MKKKRVRDKFLEELRRVPVVRVACKNCGISHNTVYRWRKEDSKFKELMDQALNEGEDMINDLAESKLLTLINDEHFSAIRFWLTFRHPKFKKSEIIKNEEQEHQHDEIIKALGLTDEDFEDDRAEATSKKIKEYLANK